MLGFLVLMIMLAVGITLLGTGLQRASGRRCVEGDDRAAAQLDRVESALTTLEARVDDLQEQQRFLERLLAERPEPRTLPGGAGGKRERALDPDPEEGSAGSVLFDTSASDDEAEER